ncbi:hypothetical protein NBRC116591_10400 [Sessilibacter corallicola]|uniref:Uncharacterized protein n=1 Tax=Sessilibacter corallicola TaxID=2904075 RepID=A0ABQ0A6F2_9GAMM
MKTGFQPMEEVRERVQAAIDSFLSDESQLLVNNSSEQAITHRLAVILEGLFEDWNVDCEYNRNQSTIKNLCMPFHLMSQLKKGMSSLMSLFTTE